MINTPVVGGEGLEIERLQAKADYTSGLYAELGRVAHSIFPDMAVKEILGNFPEWEYVTAREGIRQYRELSRPDVGEDILLPRQPSAGRRAVEITPQDRLTIRVSEITGKDMRYLLVVEKQIIDQRLSELKAGDIYARRQRLRKEFRQEAADYANATGKKTREDDLFTDDISIILSLTTRLSNYEDVGAALGYSSATISRALKETREKTGVKTYTEMMLVAVASGAASLDHIPSGLTDSVVNERYRRLMAEYYSPDPDVRQAVRRDFTYNTVASMWDRLGSHKYLGVGNRQMIVLCAIKDGLLELPDPEDIKRRLQAG